MNDPATGSVILFDGLCHLCSGVVQFIVPRDGKQVFRFASLQSAFGQEILREFNLPALELSTVILLRGSRIYTKSTAALLVAKELNRFWPILAVFIILPPFVRDGIYDFIAAHRYKWFGKRKACWIPPVEVSSRFIN